MSAAGYLLLLVPTFWLGLVVAISFLEAPIKFRAPGVTLPIGLGIGRLVFKALNAVEVVLLVVLFIAYLVIQPGIAMLVLLLALAAVLAIQLVGVRPLLTKRSDRILAGETAPRSRMHLAYVGLELIKVALLITLAVSVVGEVVA